MTYLIHKTNARGQRWTGRLWLVEADSAEAACSIGRRKYGSADKSPHQFSATLLTPEQLDEIWAGEAQRDIGVASRDARLRDRRCGDADVTTYADRRQERVNAYFDRCERNLGASLARLDSAGSVPETVGDGISRLRAAAIDKIG